MWVWVCRCRCKEGGGGGGGGGCGGGSMLASIMTVRTLTPAFVLARSCQLTGLSVMLRYVEHDTLIWDYLNSSIHLAPYLEEKFRKIYAGDAYKFYRQSDKVGPDI